MRSSETWRVNVPLLDLRREPRERKSSIRERDFLQETQCLYGELLIPMEEKDDWVRVMAPEQTKLTSQGAWNGYPGWVKKQAISKFPQEKSSNLIVKVPWTKVTTNGGHTLELPIGTRLYSHDSNESHWEISLSDGEKATVEKNDVRHINDLVKQGDSERRAAVIQSVRYCLGAPYFWGGRGVYLDDAEIKSSVDCSGLVNLAYHSCGISVPRDAHDQFLWSKRIRPEQLKAADLVFLSDDQRPGFVNHVMIYAGQGVLIEATGESNNVREISVEESLGRKLENLSRGDRKGKYNIFFGSFLLH